MEGSLLVHAMAASLHALAIVHEADLPGEPVTTSGAFALELIQRQTRRLGKLQPEVLADRDPEPLHQLRVSLRRLRTALGQFGPALELPEPLDCGRIAAIARRTGLCRDLDVLHLRLAEQLMPSIPECEQRSMERAIKRLRRDRAQAFEALEEILCHSRYLKLLARLHKWQQKPRFTSLGQLPLLPWLYEWHAPYTADLFLHPGWRTDDPTAEALHSLRKRIKGARYALEHLENWCGQPLKDWIAELRQAQDHLGELHDLQVLRRTLQEHAGSLKADQLPILSSEIERQQQNHWQHWQEQARRMRCDSNRHAIQLALMQLGKSAGMG